MLMDRLKQKYQKEAKKTGEVGSQERALRRLPQSAYLSLVFLPELAHLAIQPLIIHFVAQYQT